MEPTEHITNHTVTCEVQILMNYVKYNNVTHKYILELMYYTCLTGW